MKILFCIMTALCIGFSVNAYAQTPASGGFRELIQSVKTEPYEFKLRDALPAQIIMSALPDTLPGGYSARGSRSEHAYGLTECKGASKDYKLDNDPIAPSITIRVDEVCSELGEGGKPVETVSEFIEIQKQRFVLKKREAEERRRSTQEEVSRLAKYGQAADNFWETLRVTIIDEPNRLEYRECNQGKCIIKAYLFKRFVLSASVPEGADWVSPVATNLELIHRKYPRSWE